MPEPQRSFQSGLPLRLPGHLPLRIALLGITLSCRLACRCLSIRIYTGLYACLRSNCACCGSLLAAERYEEEDCAACDHEKSDNQERKKCGCLKSS